MKKEILNFNDAVSEILNLDASKLNLEEIAEICRIKKQCDKFIADAIKKTISPVIEQSNDVDASESAILMFDWTMPRSEWINKLTASDILKAAGQSCNKSRTNRVAAMARGQGVKTMRSNGQRLLLMPPLKK